MPYLAKNEDRYLQWVPQGRAGYWQTTTDASKAHRFGDAEAATSTVNRELETSIGQAEQVAE